MDHFICRVAHLTQVRWQQRLLLQELRLDLGISPEYGSDFLKYDQETMEDASLHVIAPEKSGSKVKWRRVF